MTTSHQNKEWAQWLIAHMSATALAAFLSMLISSLLSGAFPFDDGSVAKQIVFLSVAVPTVAAALTFSLILTATTRVFIKWTIFNPLPRRWFGMLFGGSFIGALIWRLGIELPGGIIPIEFFGIALLISALIGGLITGMSEAILLRSKYENPFIYALLTAMSWLAVAIIYRVVDQL